MIHTWRLGHLDVEDVSVRKPQDWLIQLFMLQKKLQLSLLTDFVSLHKFPNEDVVQIRSAFGDTVSACKKLANNPSAPPADTSWKSTMCDATQEFCTSVENMCIGIEHNGTLKTALKANHDPTVVLDCQNVKDTVEHILERLEKHLARSSTPPAPRQLAPQPEEAEVTAEKRLGAHLASVQTKLRDNPVQPLAGSCGDKRASAASSIDEFQAELASNSIANTMGDSTGVLAFHFDAKLAGEAATNPAVRICPLQERQ